jgi:magnesium transporter
MKRLSHKVGMEPGSLFFIGPNRTDKVTVKIFDFTETELTEREAESVQDCFSYRDTSTTTWIQITGLHEVEVIKALGDYFELHPLVQEDILNPQLRPKFEDNGTYLFFSLKRLELPEHDGGLVTDQHSIIWGDKYVISFTERATGSLEPVRERIRKTVPRSRFLNADYLAYSLMDAVIDHFFVTLETIGERIETVEDGLIDDPSPRKMSEIHNLKQQLLAMRKSIWPLREAVSLLERSDSVLIADTTRPYLRDLYDHAIHVLDSVDTYRDMVAGLMDMYMTSVSNRMNSVMKVLTIIATIFIPLSFLTGVYGMNFDHAVSPFNMPELTARYGYPLFWLTVLVVGGGLLLFFRKKKWL